MTPPEETARQAADKAPGPPHGAVRPRRLDGARLAPLLQLHLVRGAKRVDPVSQHQADVTAAAAATSVLGTRALPCLGGADSGVPTPGPTPAPRHDLLALHHLLLLVRVALLPPPILFPEVQELLRHAVSD